MKRPTMITKLVNARQKALPLVRYVAKKAIALRADLGFGFMRLGKDSLAWAADILRAYHAAAKRACEARHAIFSTEKGTPRKVAIRLLYAAAADWRRVYAPGRAWVAAIHFHNGAYHLHLAIANVDSHGKPLKFRPHEVVAMSELKYTSVALPAHGTGKGKGTRVYTKARKLAVRDLATLLADDSGRAKKAEWERLKKEGIISGFRLRKDGSPISFEYAGKRIRIATLRRFLLETQSDSSSSSGSSNLPSKDLAAINSALASGFAPSRRRSRAKTKNIKPKR